MGVLAKAAGSLWDWIEAGYPEEVAKRIVSGELPMDEASRMARASEQGYGDLLYRGHQRTKPPMSDQDMWLSSSLDDAQTYNKAANGFVHPDGLTPLRTNADYHGPGNLAYVRGDGKYYDKVTTNSIKNPGIRQGIIKGTDDIAEAVRDSGQYQGTHFRNIKDEFHTGSSTEPTDVYNILGSRPDVKIRHRDAAYDPQYTGPNIMGGLLAGGVGLGALGQSEDADAGFVTRGGRTLLEAFHGSPHKFDKFSMDQIGTGEGAQAYGHGLYFADSEDVARQYRDTLSLNGYQDNNANYSKALELGLSAGEFDRFEGMVRMAATKDGLDAGRISTDLQEYLQWPDDSMPALESFVGDYLNTLPKGNLYRTEIDVTPESLLDWDAMLDEQSRAVRSAVQDIAENGDHRFTDKQISLLNDALQSFEAGNTRGQSIIGILGDDYSVDPRSVDSAYSAAARSFKEYDYPYETALEDIKGAYPDAKPEELEWALKKEYGIGGRAGASSALSDRGIKGIKYLDGDSRAVGDGTSNYVIFDDSLINIAERGNADPRLLAGTAAGTAGLLAAPALMKDGAFQHGATSEPVVERREPVRNQSGLLASVTDFGDEVFKSVRHAAGPLADVFMPYEGINNYLKTVNDYDRQPTWWDRLGMLDF